MIILKLKLYNEIVIPTPRLETQYSWLISGIPNGVIKRYYPENDVILYKPYALVKVGV